MTICWARNSVSLWMARERIAFECGRKNIGLSRITKDEETQTSNKELNKLLARVSFLKEPQERNLFRTTIVSLNRGSFPFSPKFRTFQFEIKIWNGPFRFGPTSIFGTTFEDGLHWDRPVHFCRSYRNVPFHLTKLLSTVPLPWVLLTITITKRAGGLGRVCATGMYCSIRLVKCPNFHKRIFVEWKVPLNLKVFRMTGVQTSHMIWDSEAFYAGVFRALSRIPSHEHVGEERVMKI